MSRNGRGSVAARRVRVPESAEGKRQQRLLRRDLAELELARRQLLAASSVLARLRRSRDLDRLALAAKSVGRAARRFETAVAWAKVSTPASSPLGTLPS